MRALVTGGTGFIGSHLVEALLADGHQVRCLVRNTHHRRWLRDLPVELSSGDCTDPTTLPQAVRGCDWVFHLAGVTRTPRKPEYYLHNTQGTYNLLQACLDAAPALRRFVYLSSQAAAGPALEGRPVREDDEPHPLTPYGDSKLGGERAVRRFADRLPAVILRPSTVYGPRDRDFLHYLRWVQRGILAAFGRERRTVSMVYVKDLVACVLRAASGPAGGVYFVADPRAYPWEEVEQACHDLVGAGRARHLHLPVWALYGVAGVAELQARISRGASILTRNRLAELVEGRWACDVSRAVTELGYRSDVDLREGLQKTVAWYETEGWLQTSRA